MLHQFFKNYILPIATLSGGIIGVGFLALPYVALQVGFWPMIFYMILFTTLVTILHIMFGEISMHTPDFKRFPGFVEYHLGKTLGVVAFLLMIVGVYGTLLAYLIVGSQFLSTIFGGHTIIWALVYFLLAAILIMFGIRIISRIEFLGLVILLLALGIIFFSGFSHINISNFFISNFNPSVGGQISNLLLAFGPIVFSLWGTGLIPETEELVVRRKKVLKYIIIISTLIPAIFYTVFMVIILGVTGPETTQSALDGIKGLLGNGVISIAVFMGVLTTFISFVVQGHIFHQTLRFDLRLSPFFSFVLAIFPPLVLFLLGMTQFIGIVSFIGGPLLSIDAVLIVLMYLKITYRPAGREIRN